MDHLPKFGWPWKWLKQPPRCFRWSYVSVLALHAEHRTFGSFKSNARRILIMHMMWHSPTLTILRALGKWRRPTYMNICTYDGPILQVVVMTKPFQWRMCSTTPIRQTISRCPCYPLHASTTPQNRGNIFSTSRCKVSPGPYYQPHPGSLKSSPGCVSKMLETKLTYCKSTQRCFGMHLWLLFNMTWNLSWSVLSKICFFQNVLADRNGNSNLQKSLTCWCFKKTMGKENKNIVSQCKHKKSIGTSNESHHNIPTFDFKNVWENCSLPSPQQKLNMP